MYNCTFTGSHLRAVTDAAAAADDDDDDDNAGRHSTTYHPKISSKSVHKFASNPTNRQTNRQTDRTKNITSFFGGGNK